MSRAHADIDALADVLADDRSPFDSLVIEELADDEDARHLRAALERLPDRDRRLLELRHRDALAVAVCADLVGLPRTKFERHREPDQAEIELTTTIVVAPLRPAALLAKTAATLDVLSGGRLVLGVGAGWQPAEFAAVGVPLHERADRLTDTIAACQALWRDSPASFSSPTVSFEDVHCEPRPRHPDGIRVWFGARAGRRTIERIVRFGEGWIAPPATPPVRIVAAVAAMRAALSEAGRDPSLLHIKTVLPVIDAPPPPDWSVQ